MTNRFLYLLPLGLIGAAMLTPVAIAQNAAPTSAGGQLFKQRCQSCHSMDPAKPSTLAPSLEGVVGRKAGSTDFRYSPALKASNLTWTKANLDQFLSGPGRMVPGTRMVVSVSDAKQRADLINYLASQR
jgi:cytochrome c